MAKMLAKVGSTPMRKCAFCKYYYDPASEAINPKRGMKDIWEYETQIRKPCLKRNNMETASQNLCSKYECKL